MSSYDVPDPIVTPPARARELGEIAVKVLGQRGNELLVATSLKEAEK